jgi:hypothetical protein
MEAEGGLELTTKIIAYDLYEHFIQARCFGLIMNQQVLAMGGSDTFFRARP